MDVGIIISGVGSVCLSTLLLVGVLSIAGLFYPAAVFFCAVPIVYAAAGVLAISKTDDKPSASSMVNFLYMGTAVFAVFVFGLIPALPDGLLPYFLLADLLLLILLFVSFWRPLRR